MLSTKLSTILVMVFAFYRMFVFMCVINYVSARCWSIYVCVYTYVCTLLGISRIMWTTSYVSNIAGCTEPYKFTTTLSLCFGHLIHFVRFPRCLFANCWTRQIIAGTWWNFSILNVTKPHLPVEKQADTGSRPLHNNQHQALLHCA